MQADHLTEAVEEFRRVVFEVTGDRLNGTVVRRAMRAATPILHKEWEGELLDDEAIDRGMLAAHEISEQWWNGLSESARDACRGELRNQLQAAIGVTRREETDHA